MVKMLSNLFNKRKREIERLNDIVNKLNDEIAQRNQTFYITRARLSEAERNLKEANNTIVGLQHEISYLKMQVENAKGEVNSRYY
jgi:chromosome segregation ATPase